MSLNIKLTETEKNEARQFWDETNPITHELEAERLMAEIVQAQETINDQNAIIANNKALLLYYRAEYTEVDEKCVVLGNSLILSKQTTEIYDPSNLNVSDLERLKDKSASSLEGYITGEPDEKKLKKLLGLLPAIEKKIILEEWSSLDAYEKKVEYSLTLKKESN